VTRVRELTLRRDVSAELRILLRFGYPTREEERMSTRSLRRAVSVASLTVALGVLGPAGALGAGQIVTHKFFPLKPGNTFHYKSNQGKTVTVAVLHKTRMIQGHRSQRVETKEYEGGSLIEHFNDWYFQGEKGIVYYMKRTVARPGESWEAGKDGARKGIYLPADPKAGDCWKRTRAPNAGREGEDRACAYSVSDKTVKVKVTSSRYPEFVKFFYTKNVGLTTIKDKDETTTLQNISTGQPR
jgi:hypothetical protein